MKPDDTNKLVKLQACLKDIKTWITSNFLLLNSDKTEVIALRPKYLIKMLSSDNLNMYWTKEQNGIQVYKNNEQAIDKVTCKTVVTR